MAENVNPPNWHLYRRLPLLCDSSIRHSPEELAFLTGSKLANDLLNALSSTQMSYVLLANLHEILNEARGRFEDELGKVMPVEARKRAHEGLRAEEMEGYLDSIPFNVIENLNSLVDGLFQRFEDDKDKYRSTYDLFNRYGSGPMNRKWSRQEPTSMSIHPNRWL